MKKNLITLIILVLCFANTALTAVTVIMILPETQKANDLITQVTSAIKLDLEGGLKASSANAVSMEDLKTYTLPEELTINLKKSEDGTAHMAVIQFSISMDSTHEDYGTYGANLEGGAYDATIQDTIISVVSQHTADDMNDKQQTVKAEITEALQEAFSSTFIVGVNFASFMIS